MLRALDLADRSERCASVRTRERGQEEGDVTRTVATHWVMSASDSGKADCCVGVTQPGRSGPRTRVGAA